MFKILNELVEIPINDHLISADRRTRGGHNQAYKQIRANTKILFDIELSPSKQHYIRGSDLSKMFEFGDYPIFI